MGEIRAGGEYAPEVGSPRSGSNRVKKIIHLGWPCIEKTISCVLLPLVSNPRLLQ